MERPFARRRHLLERRTNASIDISLKKIAEHKQKKASPKAGYASKEREESVGDESAEKPVRLVGRASRKQ